MTATFGRAEGDPASVSETCPSPVRFVRAVLT
ncbi:hypothetical protein SAMN04515671_3449 [Nakamurella panacisegetis]|uniref:Uncharacterized protein n=1 Tax=Nakamurella panacisegetis TaxID=1090615 RepID=A0A1H0RA48_9ACTN|nr:hypothetical protein SAMN04515671_3449 [Nakamurella panacisegetis]